MLKRIKLFSFRLYLRHKLLCHVLFGLYLTLCLGLIAARWVFSTQLEPWRDTITQSISTATGIDVQAGHLTGGFYRIWPTLELDDVTLSRPGGPVSLRLPKVQARLSWSSLWHLEPRFELLQITRPNLTIRRLTPTRFDIAGWVLDTKIAEDAQDVAPKPTPAKDDAQATKRLLAWLFGQSRLAIVDGTFSYEDLTTPTPRIATLNDTHLLFEKRLMSYRLGVKTRVAKRGRIESANVRLSVTPPLLGEKTNPKTWAIQGFASVDNSDVAAVLRRMGLPRLLKSGVGSARLWVTTNPNKDIQVSGQVAIRDVNAKLRSDLQPLTVTGLGATLAYDRKVENKEERHTLTLSDLTLNKDGKDLGPLTIGVDVTRGENGLEAGRFTANHLDIAQSVAFIPSVPLPQPLRDFILEQRPSALLDDVAVGFKGNIDVPQNWYGEGRFAGLALKASEKTGLPGFKNLSGRVKTDAGSAAWKVALKSKNVQLQFPGLFNPSVLYLDTLKGNVDISLADTPTVHFDKVKVENRDASLYAQGQWSATGGAGTLDLEGQIERARLSALYKYLPLSIGEDGLNWLRYALISGWGKGGHFRLNGPLEDFPFDKKLGSGHFEVKTQVKDATINFKPEIPVRGRAKLGDWPLLKHVNADLTLLNEGLMVENATAQSMGLKAKNVNVKIPTLFEPLTILVSADIAGEAKDAVAYLKRARVIADIVNPHLTTLSAKGPVSTHLTLSLPLAKTENLRFSALTDLNDNTVQYGPAWPVISHVSGQVIIDEEGVKTKTPLTGQLPAGEVSATITTENHVINVAAQAQVGAPALWSLSGLTDKTLRETVTGETPMTALFTSNLKEKTWELTLNSSLTGLTSTWPAPFEKDPIEMAPLRVVVKGQPERVTLDALMEDRASALAHWTLGKTPQLDALSLALGDAQRPRAQTGGLSVAIKTDELDLQPWVTAIKPLLNGKDDSSTLRLDTVNVQVDDLKANDATLTTGLKASVVRTTPTQWYADVKSRDITGAGTFTRRTNAPNQLQVTSQRLHIRDEALAFLRSLDDETDATKTEPPIEALPDVTLQLQDVVVGPYQIGNIGLKGQGSQRPEGALWRADAITITNPALDLKGSLAWLKPKKDPQGQTNVDLNATVHDSGDLLTRLSFPNVIHKAPGKVLANLNWVGSPLDPSLESLNGTLSVDAKSGAFLQADPGGAGRLLSLLSMQHLLKRLTLDFSDVINKGFNFDTIVYQGTISKGVVNLPKATVLGSAAAVALGGTVDLVTETLDMTAVVLPSINTGAPALALTLVNPAVGLSTFIGQWLLKDKINNLFKAEYRIKGSFADPTIEDVESPDKTEAPATP